MCLGLVFGVFLTSKGSPGVKRHVISIESSSLILHGSFRDLFVSSCKLNN